MATGGRREKSGKMLKSFLNFRSCFYMRNEMWSNESIIWTFFSLIAFLRWANDFPATNDCALSIFMNFHVKNAKWDEKLSNEENLRWGRQSRKREMIAVNINFHLWRVVKCRQEREWRQCEKLFIIVSHIMTVAVAAACQKVPLGGKLSWNSVDTHKESLCTHKLRETIPRPSQTGAGDTLIKIYLHAKI